MDISSIIGSAGEKKEEKPTTEYTAQVVSPIVNGEAKLKIGRNSFTVASTFDVAEVFFVNMDSLSYGNYTTTVKTDHGDYVLSNMGNWAQPFFDALCDAYNKAMLRAFFVSGDPLSTANGDYRLTESGVAGSGKATVSVYDNCVALLPNNSDSRRIPLCFVDGAEKANFGAVLKLNTGENYAFSKLGQRADPLMHAIEKQIRALRERSVSLVKELDPSLTAAQASQIAKLTPEGVAAPVGKLAAIAPSFPAAVEKRMSKTRPATANSYEVFKKMCDPADIWIGFKKNDNLSEAEKNKYIDAVKKERQDANLGIETSPEDEAKKESTDLFMFWIIAPSPNGEYMAVEFAVQKGESAATFVYRTGGDFSKAAMQLNRALEAISFRREVIRLSDEELLKPENADYYMASKRTASLQFVRANFVGRVIHSSNEAWEQNLMKFWN